MHAAFIGVDVQSNDLIEQLFLRNFIEEPEVRIPV
jgi:hypothetical protein